MTSWQKQHTTLLALIRSIEQQIAVVDEYTTEKQSIKISEAIMRCFMLFQISLRDYLRETYGTVSYSARFIFNRLHKKEVITLEERDMLLRCAHRLIDWTLACDTKGKRYLDIYLVDGFAVMASVTRRLLQKAKDAA